MEKEIVCPGRGKNEMKKFKMAFMGIFASLIFALAGCGGGGGSTSGGGSNAATITGTVYPTVVSKSTDGVCDIDINIAVSVTFSTI